MQLEYTDFYSTIDNVRYNQNARRNDSCAIFISLDMSILQTTHIFKNC